jgi:hypothetical protein
MCIDQSTRILASHQRHRLKHRQQCVLLRTAVGMDLSMPINDQRRTVDQHGATLGVNQS